MSKRVKLIERLKASPADFTWDELKRLMLGFGFDIVEGGGSRVKFFHADLNRLICIHKPHPTKIVKPYVIKELLLLFFLAELRLL